MEFIPVLAGKNSRYISMQIWTYSAHIKTFSHLFHYLSQNSKHFQRNPGSEALV